MYGSIFYNFWAAIIGFSIYFFGTLSDSLIPFNNLGISLIAAAASFIIMFAIRYLLGYIFYMPNDDLFNSFNKENERMREQIAKIPADSTNTGTNTSTMEFKDQNSEEIAKVVKSMMMEEESAKS